MLLWWAKVAQDRAPGLVGLRAANELLTGCFYGLRRPHWVAFRRLVNGEADIGVQDD